MNINSSSNKKNKTQETPKCKEESRLLQTLALELSQSEDIKQGLKIMLQKICEFSKWQYGEVWILDHDTNQIKHSSIDYYQINNLKEFSIFSKTLTFARGEGLIGKVWKSKESQYVKDVTKDPYFKRSQIAKKVGLKTAIAIPIHVREEMIGVLAFFTQRFQEEDKRLINLISAISAELSAVIQRRRADEAIKYSKAYLEKLNDAIQDGVFTVRLPERRIEYINKAVEKIFGYSRDELIGQSTEIIYPDKWEYYNFGQKLKFAIEKGKEILQTEQLYKRKNGQIFNGKISVTFTREKQELHAIGIVKDITERKIAENALESKKQELILQNKITSNFLNILEITSTSLNFYESLNKLLPHIKNLTESSYCLVCLVDEDKGILQPIYHFGLPKEKLSYFMSMEIKIPETKSLLPKKEVGFFSKVSGISNLSENIKNFLRIINVKSLITIPIIYHKNPVAFIALPYDKIKFFTKQDKYNATKLHKHLEAFYLSYQHTQDLLHDTMSLTQKLEMIKAMSAIDRIVLSSTIEEEVIFRAVKFFRQVVPNDVVEILRFDSEKRIFNLSVIQEEGRIIINPDEVFDEQSIKSWENIMFGIPSYYPDISKNIFETYEKRFYDRSFKSLLILPLLSKGELIGLIAIGNRKIASYSSKQLEITQRLGNQIAVALSNTGLIKQLQDLLIGTVNSLATALDAKSPWTQGHSQRVSNIAISLGKQLHLNDDELYNLRIASLFHDVGKIGTYDILLDKPDKLSDKEFALIKNHPVKTYEILAPIPQLEKIGKIAKHHHEKWDGSGYPDGLTGDNIPFFSRIITLADAYDAMSSDRPYRKKFSVDKIIDEIQNLSGSQFDPEIADVFISIIRKQPKEFLQKAKAA